MGGGGWWQWGGGRWDGDNGMGTVGWGWQDGDGRWGPHMEPPEGPWPIGTPPAPPSALSPSRAGGHTDTCRDTRRGPAPRPPPPEQAPFSRPPRALRPRGLLPPPGQGELSPSRRVPPGRRDPPHHLSGGRPGLPPPPCCRAGGRPSGLDVRPHRGPGRHCRHPATPLLTSPMGTPPPSPGTPRQGTGAPRIGAAMAGPTGPPVPPAHGPDSGSPQLPALGPPWGVHIGVPHMAGHRVPMAQDRVPGVPRTGRPWYQHRADILGPHRPGTVALWAQALGASPRDSGMGSPDHGDLFWGHWGPVMAALRSQRMGPQCPQKRSPAWAASPAQCPQYRVPMALTQGGHVGSPRGWHGGSHNLNMGSPMSQSWAPQCPSSRGPPVSPTSPAWCPHGLSTVSPVQHPHVPSAEHPHWVPSVPSPGSPGFC